MFRGELKSALSAGFSHCDKDLLVTLGCFLSMVLKAKDGC